MTETQMLLLETPIHGGEPIHSEGFRPVLRLLTDANYRPLTMAIAGAPAAGPLRRPADARYRMYEAERMVKPSWLRGAAIATLPQLYETDRLNGTALDVLGEFAAENCIDWDPAKIKRDPLTAWASPQTRRWVVPAGHNYTQIVTPYEHRILGFLDVPDRELIAAGLRFVVASTVFADAVDVNW
ncbi:MAG TPA: hypothetical protein VLF91_00615 [Candidatus Saccharimonadales bacterium]|nr:hypothetical protein [Candidatus Saccharimonadales bacterium]